jgi:glycogen operon protein
MLVDGGATDEVDERGRPISGASLLLLMNAGEEALRFVLPRASDGHEWRTILCTSQPADARAADALALAPHTLVLLEEVEGQSPPA